MKPRLSVLALLVLATSTAVARDEAPSYLDRAAVDAVKLLPGPPSATSQEARDELSLMLLMQEKRSKQDVDRCQSEVKLKIDAFQNVLGPWLTERNVPRLARLFTALETDSKRFSDAVK